MNPRPSPMLLSLIALAAVCSPLRVLADPPHGGGGGGGAQGFGGPQGTPRGDGGNPMRGDRGPQRAEDPLSDSVRRIERSTRGQVLSAERMQSDGRDVNRIKVVDERGRVRVYMDEPRGNGGERGRQPPDPTRGKPW